MNYSKGAGPREIIKMTYQYPNCDFLNCGDEGYYHCRLCGKNWCWEHTCEHLQGAQNDIPRIYGNCEDNSRVGSVETDNLQTIHLNYSQSERDLSEQQLQQELKNCFKRAKQIQRELERRMIECSGLEYQYGFSRNGNNPRAGPSSSQSPTRRRKRLTKETKVNLALQELLNQGFNQQQILQLIFKK